MFASDRSELVVIKTNIIKELMNSGVIKSLIHYNFLLPQRKFTQLCSRVHIIPALVHHC